MQPRPPIIILVTEDLWYLESGAAGWLMSLHQQRICAAREQVPHLRRQSVGRVREAGQAGRERGELSVARRGGCETPPLHALQVEQVLRQAHPRLHLGPAQVMVRLLCHLCK